MGGSMARKESRAPNGHPAELKKEEETAVQQLAVRRSLYEADPLICGNIPVFCKKPKRHAGNSMHPPKIWPRKKKNTVLSTKYSAFFGGE